MSHSKISLSNLKRRFTYLVIFVMLTLLWVQTTNKLTAWKEIISKNQLKYILLWTDFSWAPFFNQSDGQEPFIRNNCSFKNCYITDNKNYFGNAISLSNFDGIFYNGVILSNQLIAFPEVRYPHQKYVFFTLESGDNYPICDKIYDGFFNWTSSFILESDVAYPYVMIRDMTGNIVGPKKNMEWVEKMHEVDESLIRRFQNKSKAVAWFVSNCRDINGRLNYVYELNEELKLHGLNVDIYGECGSLTCGANESCYEMLRNSYYFYLAMENSFSMDYVTEKILTALNNDALPVVYGAANYSWFLPPGSYLDARAHKAKELADIIHNLITFPKTYYQYFRWTYHYTYHNPTEKENVCAICAAFNDKKKMETHSVYEKFREWWNPNYEKICQGSQLLRYREEKKYYSLNEILDKD